MTDAQIIAALATRSPLPGIYAIISEFRISYQQSKRCWAAAGGTEGDGGVEPVKKVYTLEDF